MRRVLMLVCACLLAVEGLAQAQGFRVGPTFGVSNAVPVKRRPDVAYGGGVYFVVYGQGVVQGEFVSDAGVVVANVGSVAAVPGFQQTPRVTYNPDNNNFLVTWLDWRICDSCVRPYGRIVSFNGGAPAFVSPEFEIAIPAGSIMGERGAAVAYSTVSKNFLVAWHQFGPPNNDIHARLVAPAGVPVLGEIAITNDNAFQGEVEIAYNPVRDEYYVVYNFEDSAGIGHILANRVQASTGALLDLQPGRSLTQGAFRSAPAVIFNPVTSQYLVGWYQSTPGTGLYGIVVNGDGSPATPTYPLSTFYYAYDAFGLAYNPLSGTSFGVTHGPREDAAFEVNNDGVPNPAFLVTDTPAGSGNFNPRIAASTSAKEWLLATSFSLTQIVGQRLGSNATGPIINPPNPCSNVSINPTSVSVQAPAGGGSIAITAAPDGCTWTASSNAGFLIPAASSGTGTSLTYSFAANTAPSARSATIKFSGGLATFTLTQQGQSSPWMWIDLPYNNTVVSQPFLIAGWAVDRASTSGPGMDVVHVYAYPNPGSGQPAIFLGGAAYGGARPDLGALLGSQFTNCGWGLIARGLTPGPYMIVAYARSLVTGGFNIALAIIVTVGPSAAMNVDTPGPGPVPGGNFVIAGWALDQAAPGGVGVDAVHAYAYPNGGGPAILLGGATLGDFRPDVGAFFGSQFSTSGFHVNVNGLPPGTYMVVVFARSTVAQSFNNVRVVWITVP